MIYRHNLIPNYGWTLCEIMIRILPYHDNTSYHFIIQPHADTCICIQNYGWLCCCSWSKFYIIMIKSFINLWFNRMKTHASNTCISMQNYVWFSSISWSKFCHIMIEPLTILSLNVMQIHASNMCICMQNWGWFCSASWSKFYHIMIKTLTILWFNLMQIHASNTCICKAELYLALQRFMVFTFSSKTFHHMIDGIASVPYDRFSCQKLYYKSILSVILPILLIYFKFLHFHTWHVDIFYY